MTDARALARLRALFDAILGEAQANRAFAERLEAAIIAVELAVQGGLAAGARNHAAPTAKPKDGGDAHTLLHTVTFDPLECQIESALLNGREQEARAFLGRLDRAQLGAVIKAQRLPGAKSLQQRIQEADAASAVDAIVGSAAEKVRNRHSAAS